MNLVYQSAFLKALGWSLLDSLWQMGLLWLLYVVLTANGKKFTARQRHSLALLSLAGGSCWFLITLAINFYKAAAAPEVITLVVNAGDAFQPPATRRAVGSWMEPVLPFVSVAYLVITALLLVRFYRQYHFTRKLFTQGLQKAQPELRVFVQQAVQHMTIPRKVTLWLSTMVDTPLTIGFWKPIILLPVAAVNNLTIEQTEAIILHELNHIRRNDYLVNLLIASTDIIFFFNPFARLFSGILRRERENSCDDMVLQFKYDATQYARALLTLEQSRSTIAPALAVAATGKSNYLLLNRVKRMLTNEPASNAISQKLAAWLLSALLIGFIGLSNPGRAIITRIEQVAVKAPQSPFIEYASDISTPADPEEAEEASPAIAQQSHSNRDKDCDEQEDDNETNENEFITEQEIAAIQHELSLLALQQHEVTKEVVAFVNTKELRDFSLQVTKEAMAIVPASMTQPYVPVNSFSIQELEDTLLPKPYTLTTSEKQARESMDKALKALEAIDWEKLEKGLNATAGQVDVQALQVEIVKAFKNVDWMKVNQETEKALQLSSRQLSEEQVMLKARLEKFNHQRQERQEKLKQAQQQIVMERLQLNEKPANCQQPAAPAEPKPVRKKKIVVI
ncbi:M56 family metallopeptidase [Paraflavitalea sp. CAU 1676]|uniref:M56 family metallopeptidase n=1 Tax=Paraflavitalea sp. CAU 1676 TaxID=3032598 RepID=UPI0023D9EAFE|nr:M56 family metallopeptidase [Paraflavitalea sp. CAU 1676]MDF2191972.1 M56 family metallopeptidase [Paraflavitalea sp. CAU 1676]